MKPDFEKNLKSWFEANFLDGDLIQRGQMISSEECFRIACEAHLEGRKAQMKDCAALVKSWHYKKGGYETLAKAIESQEIKP